MIALDFYLFIYLFILHPRTHTQHMEVSSLGVESELQLLTYAMATVTPDLSHVCNLHHGSWQHRIFNLLNKATD